MNILQPPVIVRLGKFNLLMKKLLTAFLLLLLAYTSRSQTCNAPGQRPSTAFPVCGTKVFNQVEVPICRTSSLVVPGCSGADYADKNPYWYKFTCYETGTLGFLVTPKDLGDDYDWQLYDITGHDPNDVFTDASLVVTGNWAGTFGKTGASGGGVAFIQCASDPAANLNSFSKMPQLVQGHEYLLLVSHYTPTQSGYNLEFGGGTANITDPVIPHLKTSSTICSGDVVHVKLNKKMKCNSIAKDGSDFFVSAGAATVTGVEGIGCASGFDTDSLEIKLNQPLAPGTYQLGVKKGSDGNTLLDYCDNALSETEVISFIVYPIAPTPMDSMETASCSPQQIKLIFRKPISCASIATNGSDFSIIGGYPVSILSAKGSCTNGSTNEIIISLASALQQKGSFVLTLKNGTDGNTLLDECAQPTPAGSSLSFTVMDTVNANFTYAVNYSCALDAVNYFHDGRNEVNSWKWNLDDNKSSTQQNPQGNYIVFQPKNISLVVSNGFCSDTTKQTVALDNLLKVDFSVVPDNCPLEPVVFTSLAEGKITVHNWSFGDGGSSAEKSPQHIFQQPMRETPFMVKYEVTDSYGCTKSITKPIVIYSSCTVFVPNAFTPNGDGLNDVFRILNGVKTQNFNLKIFNRWGQPVFETKDWKQGWDGRYKGLLQTTGTFVWLMQYNDLRTNKSVERKGSVTLVR
jgi:gliding motility-associated-like protein